MQGVSKEVRAVGTSMSVIYAEKRTLRPHFSSKSCRFDNVEDDRNTVFIVGSGRKKEEI